MAEQQGPRLVRMLPFIGVMAVFLYIANLVVYEAVAGIFAIAMAWQLVVLGTALGILSASLILSLIIGMQRYNAFTRLYSSLAAIWIGFFVYLFFACVIYGLLVMMPIGPVLLIGKILLAGAVLLSGYGIAHAWNIRIRKIELSLPNLPAVWKGKTAVWVSDLHLGQIHGPSFAERVAVKIAALQPDIVFIGGDLFDGTTAPDIRALILPLKELSVPQGVYFITGNHEEFGNSGKFISAVESIGITVLQDRMIEKEGLQIIGADYRNAAKKERFRTILSELSIDAAKPSILLKHEPKDLVVARDAGISLQISGHTHRAQLWPLGYLANLIYKGYAYGLKPLGTMQVFTSSGTGTWGPPMRVGTDCEIVVFTFT